MWTAENDSNTLRVDAKIFASAKEYLREKKFPDTCGHGLIVNINILFLLFHFHFDGLKKDAI